MRPTIEFLDQALKKRFLCISQLEKENDALTAESQTMKQILKDIRSKLR